MRPWATVLRVPTADGMLYFKEPTASLAHEARLIEMLARRRPELVTEIVFSDEDGRMLMRDAGRAAGSSRDPDLAGATGRWRYRSMPSCRSRRVQDADGSCRPERSTAVRRSAGSVPRVDRRACAGSDGGGVRAIARAGARVGARCARNSRPARCQRPSTTTTSPTGAFHVAGGGYRFLDWGDACVSHPFMTLTVTQRVIEIRHGCQWGRRRSVGSTTPISSRSHASRHAQSSTSWSSRRAESARSAELPCARPTWTGKTIPRSWLGRSGSCSIRKPGAPGSLSPKASSRLARVQ